MKAFPSDKSTTSNDPNIVKNIEEGMDLRDYFAAKAMQGMVIETIPDRVIPGSNGETETDLLVERAYKIADAMLKAREK